MSDQAAHPDIVAALDALPASLLARSGSIFYTGRNAFFAASPIYIMGLNPGGDPLAQAGETIASSRSRFHDGTPQWSAYSDDSWCGAAPGKWGMQPRVLHMINRLGLNIRAVPASNTIFVRSPTEAKLEAEKADLFAVCWPVHRAVIKALSVQAVLCFGGTAGRWVREALKAKTVVDSYVEENERRWRSDAHQASDGRVVITLTHPSRANWCNPASDPTPLVQRTLARLERV